MADNAKYDPKSIEPKWQQYWQAHQTFRAFGPGEPGFDASKKKYYVLDMFPYPSGAGLHVGHPEGYTATDIVARYRRMRGFNVLHPMGYDAFGLPAQQYAVEHGIHPRVTTERNIANIERQIKMFGFSYDWSRRLATTDPGYYRWTQWIFLQLFNSWFDPAAGKARPISALVAKLTAEGVPQVQQQKVIDASRLAYMAEVPVNWCPALGTVLANEEVTNEGRSERGDHPVYRRALRQWMLRITAYADRLEDDLAMVDWPESIKIMQRNWIGRSEGADIDFQIVGSTGFQPVSGSGSTGFQPVSTPPFTKAARDSTYRPTLTATGFIGMNPFPPGEPTPGQLMVQIRNLPHLSLPNATYFVTFHCRPGIGLDEDRKKVVLDAMLHWHGQRCTVFAAVVLDDHAHMIVKATAEFPIAKLLHSIKRHSGYEIRQLLGGEGPVWQEECFDHIVRDASWFTQFVYYICENPVRRGLATRFSDYPWLVVNRDLVCLQDSGEAFGNWSFARGEENHGLETRATSENHGLETRATKDVIRVFTTRPDTLFGATYMVLAPEHPLVERITTPAQRDAVKAYVAQAARKSELERMVETKDKTGVFTGAYAINPAIDWKDPLWVNQGRIPIWIADYVMMGYGTGAIMAVPSHDERDMDFAVKFGIPTQNVVMPPDDWLRANIVSSSKEDPIERLRETYRLTNAYFGQKAFTEAGVAINSGPYNGLPTVQFKKRITADLAAAGLGKAAVNYKLRDWIFSRQWYWGEPFPIVHCPTCGTVGVPDDQLPVLLPDLENFNPEISDDPNAPPRPPLGRAKDWAATVCPCCSQPAQRELNAMPQWAGSCWYYLRYLDAANSERSWDPAREKYWLSPGGVDLYVGGAEHAVLHLLYARFWHKVLFDLGHVSTPEPFAKLVNQGMIRSFAYRDKRGSYIGYDDVDLTGDKPRHRTTGEELAEAIEKMSKSLKNVVNPDEVIVDYGADTFRLYEMFMGPLESSKPWNTRDVPGLFRFLNRVWRLIVDDRTGAVKVSSDVGSPGFQPGNSRVGNPCHLAVERSLHRTIKKVGEDIEAFKFNTAIAAMMEFVNEATAAERITASQAERFVLVLAPFTPHLAEELWQRLGHATTLAYEPFPSYDPAMLVESTIEMPVQVNGKLRGKIVVAADADPAAVEAAAKADPNVVAQLAGKAIRKVIVLKGKLVNIVAN